MPVHVIDLKGNAPTKQTVADMLRRMRAYGSVRVVNAYRVAQENPVSARFTKKEQLVINGIRRGLSNRAIAHEIGTTEQVIKNCCRQMGHKTGVKTRLQLLIHLTDPKELCAR